MKAFFIVVPFLVGCATYQPSQLINVKFKPARSGVIKMGNSMSANQARIEATGLMKRLCGEQRAEITEVSTQATPTGSTNIQGTGFFNGMSFSENTSVEDKFVHFQCVDTEQAELDL